LRVSISQTIRLGILSSEVGVLSYVSVIVVIFIYNMNEMYLSAIIIIGTYEMKSCFVLSSEVCVLSYVSVIMLVQETYQVSLLNLVCLTKNKEENEVSLLNLNFF
jgi:hypothetical protein